MPSGLEVYNGSGQLIFDAATNLSRLIATIGVGTSNGSASFPAVSNYIVAWPTKYTGGVPPQFFVSGTTVSWDFGTTPVQFRSGCTLLILGY